MLRDKKIGNYNVVLRAYVYNWLTPDVMSVGTVESFRTSIFIKIALWCVFNLHCTYLSLSSLSYKHFYVSCA